MHDRKGRPLQVGDIVLVPARVAEISAQTDDFCNVTLESLYGRRPDGQKERICAINTGVTVRANSLIEVIDPD